MSIKNPTLANFRHYRHLKSIWICSIITYFQKHLILTNKPNFRNDKMSANLFTTKDYEENGHSGHQKTNPITPEIPKPRFLFKISGFSFCQGPGDLLEVFKNELPFDHSS